MKLIQFIINRYFSYFIFSLFLLFFILSIFHIGKQGTWNDYYFLSDSSKSQNKLNRYKKKSISKKSKGETECRRVLESIFKKPFVSVRPSFLKNRAIQSHHNLELDCFNQDLRIAVEYNGQQHYKFTPFFHKNREAFQNQQYRDYIKKDLCKKNNIILIEVPYTIPFNKIEHYLIDKLKYHKLM